MTPPDAGRSGGEADPGMPPGILTALVTPFNADGTPDLAALATLIDFQAGAGVQGLFVTGTSGEGMLMSPPERRAVVESVAASAEGRLPLLVHCGAPDTRTTVELARHAASLAVEAVASIAPYYFSYGGPALVDHFTTVAKEASELVHYVYDNPGRVGYEIGVPTVTRLVEDVANIVGVKDTGDSIGRITGYLLQPSPPQVYTGNNLTIYPALVVGARGAVSALANAVPELVAAIYEAWRSGEPERALELQLTLARLQCAVEGLPYLAAVKELMALRGLPSGGLRAPQPGLEDAQRQELGRRLAAHQDLAPWLAPAA